MGVATNPTIYWTTRTVAPSLSRDQKHALPILHILIAAPGCCPGFGFLHQYTNVDPTELNFRKCEEKSRSLTYLLDQLAAISNSEGDLRSFTFVLPYTCGYITRSDFLHHRLQMFLKSHKISSFRDPLEYCRWNEAGKSQNNLIEILDTTVGVISGSVNTEFDQAYLERQICDRISYPWLSLHPIGPQRLALVRGRPNFRVGNPVYSAAKALGVSLVIVDENQHWLQAETPRNKQLREAFLTIDMKEDDDLPHRITAAIKDYPAKIDGIFTLSDNYLVAVAQAAELLGLPSSPSSAYETAFDKRLTRQLHAAPYEYASVKSEEDFHIHLADGSFRPQYPLIVKPRTRGWNSQFVRKVHNREKLHLAIQEICPRYNNGVVIEPYYDGPEIDVNMVMIDGQNVFQEIVDEPPSCGDLSHESSADFLENGMRAPSILPQQEQQIIFDSISNSLLKAGFTNGVFHVEARISQSSMEFRDENGSIDLVSASPTASEKVRCHLIEINARPPGLRAQILTQLTYGVDYFAVQILSAVDDRERVKTSCIPFNLPHFPQGAQSWSQLVHLPVLSKGITTGVAGIEKLLRQLPDVASYVVEYQCCFNPGEALPDPGEQADFFGHCIVSSVKGRRHVVKTADKIRKAYQEKGVECTIDFSPSYQKSVVLYSTYKG